MYHDDICRKIPDSLKIAVFSLGNPSPSQAIIHWVCFSSGETRLFGPEASGYYQRQFQKEIFIEAKLPYANGNFTWHTAVSLL